MAVRTPNNAFSHFRKQYARRHALTNEIAHSGPLFTPDVIELQDANFGLAAIDARMLQEVVQHERSIASPV